MNDAKKVQTLVNATALEIAAIRAAVTRLKAIRAKYVGLNPAPVIAGTVLAGNLTALSNAITALDTAASAAVLNTVAAGYVPTHRGGAI